MPKIAAMPAPWKRTKNRGEYFRPIKGGNLVFRPADETFGVEVATGTSPNATNVWGSWRGVLEDEQEVLSKVEDWIGKLVAAGWTTMPHSTDYTVPGTQIANEKAMVKVLARLPRCEAIPRGLLNLLDETTAREGKSVKGGVLRVAGHDVHVEVPGRNWGAELKGFRSYLTVQKPGAPRRAEGGLHMDLGVDGLDALIDFLVETRQGMVSYDDYKAMTAPLSKPSGDEDGATRIARVRGRAELTATLHRELSEADDEQMRTVVLMAQMIMAGDMTVDLIHGDGVEGNLH